MTSHHCRRYRLQDGSRRDMLQKCSLGFGAFALAGMNETLHAATREEALAPKATHFDAKARSVIFLYMDGGVSQVDSFDPKPRLDKENGKPFPTKIEPTQFNNIGNTLASPWKFKQYGESGIPVSDLFPHVAQHVDDLTVVRSMETKVLFLCFCLFQSVNHFWFD